MVLAYPRKVIQRVTNRKAWEGLGYVPDRVTRGTAGGPPGGAGTGSGFVVATGPSSGVTVDLSPTAIALLTRPTIPGYDGADGEDGGPGPPGPPGTGSPGPQGAQGFQGPPGWDGLGGEDGQPGPPGVAGPAGSAGAPGPTGPQGPPIFGWDGQDGEDGITIPGAPGAAGAAGATGSAGSAGLTIPGWDGLDGEDGVTIPPPFALPVPVAQGGTGDTTLTAHGVLIGEGTSAVAVTSAGTAGQVFTSNGASADPTFQTGPAMILDQQVITADAQTSVTLTPSGLGTHLMIVIEGSSAQATVGDAQNVQFNGDTASHYDFYTLLINGATPTLTPGYTASQTFTVVGYLAGQSTITKAGQIVAFINNYRGTTFDKSVSTTDQFFVSSTEANSYIIKTGGDWQSSAAITSIKFVNSSGAAYTNNTVFSLYRLA